MPQRNILYADYLSAGRVTPTGGTETTLGAALAAPLAAIRHLRYPSGARLIPFTCSPGTATANATSGRIFYMPFYAPGVTISGMWVQVTTAAAQLCRLGLYTAHPTTGLPDALVRSVTAEIDLSGTAGERSGSFAANYTLPDRIVWAAMATSTGGPAAVLAGASTPCNGYVLRGTTGGDFNLANGKGYVVTATYGPLADSANTSGIGFVAGHLIGLIVA